MLIAEAHPGPGKNADPEQPLGQEKKKSQDAGFFQPGPEGTGSCKELRQADLHGWNGFGCPYNLRTIHGTIWFNLQN